MQCNVAQFEAPVVHMENFATLTQSMETRGKYRCHSAELKGKVALLRVGHPEQLESLTVLNLQSGDLFRLRVLGHITL